MIKMLTRADPSCSCQGHAKRLGHRRWATLERKIPGQLGILCRHGEMRLHEEPHVRASPHCWLAKMFAECWGRKLDSEYTIVGLSGQGSASTYS
jgi:hypothetical protein